MFRKLVPLVSLLLLAGLPVLAERATDTAAVSADTTARQAPGSGLRISLVTCGVGEELYASFGHTALRVIDSVAGTDTAFNYGTFEFSDPDFYPKFVRGKLLYYVNAEDYRSFISTYIYERRSIEEQVLLLSTEQKMKMYEFLQYNALPENKYYKYDFLFDNCATRIRDVFPKSLGEDFKFGPAIPADSRLTYRNIIDHYLRNKHWERFGIDLALGSPIDVVMTNEGTMFLPDYLRDGIGKATYKGKPVTGPVKQILPGSEESEGGLNGPLVLTSVIALLTILGLTVPRLRILGKIMSSILLFITGLLGVFFLFMWFGTDHQSCQNNYNVLWALPTNGLLVFWKPKGIAKYSLVAIALIVVSSVLHVLGIQGLPLLELGPILLSLVFIFGMIYKKNRVETSSVSK